MEEGNDESDVDESGVEVKERKMMRDECQLWVSQEMRWMSHCFRVKDRVFVS